MLFGLLCWLACSTSTTWGQTKPVESSATETIESKAEIEQELQAARKRLQDAIDQAENPEAVPESLRVTVDRLVELNLVLEQQEAVDKQFAELKANQKELQKQLAELRQNGLPDAPPYSFLKLDQTRDELVLEQTQIETFEATIEAAADALAEAQKTRTAAERRRRQLREQLDESDDEPEPTVRAELAEAVFQSRLAAANERLRKAEYQLEWQSLVNAKLREEYLTAYASQLQNSVTFRSEDLQEPLAKLQQRASELKRLQDQLTRESAQLQASRTQTPGETALKPATVEQIVEANRLQREVNQQRLAIVTRQLARVGTQETAWERRFDVINKTATEAEQEDWQQDATETLNDLQKESRLQAIRVRQARQKLNGVLSNLDSASSDDTALITALTEQRDTLETQIDALETDLLSIENTRRLVEKLNSEIVGDESRDFQAWIATIWKGIQSAWNYELFSVEDRPITVRKIAIGLLLFLLGFWASRRLSRSIAHRMLPRLRIHENAAFAIQKILFYILIVTVTLMVLRYVNVPLTIFTVLGGALALGVGFGSQNIINNFISGLILLAERPIRVGDMIELDGLYGTVLAIGARSTKIRTGANLEIIVPNSNFLENRVSNWTLSDNKIRTFISVGVAYGSPLRDVVKLLKRAAEEHGLVLDKPEPTVLFTEFGDNSLTFELHFWMRVRVLFDRLRVESDVRMRIDGLFRDADISIAFPQRDLHLDSLSPLKVQVVSEADANND